MEDVRWLNEREERAWRALQFMQMRLTGRLASDVAATSDLSYADYVVLVALGDGTAGRARPFELAHILGWEQSRVSHQIARMGTRGLVKKERCDDDRRGAYVAATQKGRKAIAAAAPRHVATVRRLFIDQLTTDELEVIASVAERVLEVLDEEEAASDNAGSRRGEERARG